MQAAVLLWPPTKRMTPEPELHPVLASNELPGNLPIYTNLPQCLNHVYADRADHMWWASTPGRASHPNPEAPRCLPCEFDDSKFDHSLKPFNAPKGCPCTAQLICETDERGIFNQYCDVPKAPMSTYSMHGGAGGIISVGMLRAVSLDYMEKCVKSLYSTGICFCVNLQGCVFVLSTEQCIIVAGKTVS